MSSPSSSTTTSFLNDDSLPSTPPEFIGVILAGTCGAKLFPLTSAEEENDFYGTSDDDEDEHKMDSADEDSSDSDANDGSKDVVMEEATSATKNDKDIPSSQTLSNSNTDDKDTKSQPNYFPKHLLPLAGRPIVHHLLSHVQSVGLEWCIVAIGSKDHVTLPSLLAMEEDQEFIRKDNGSTVSFAEDGKDKKDSKDEKKQQGVRQIPIVMRNMSEATSLSQDHDQPEEQQLHSHHHDTLVRLKWKGINLFVYTAPDDCPGNAEVLRLLSNISFRNKVGTGAPRVGCEDEGYHPVVPNKSHIMVMPADLIMYGELGMSDSSPTSSKSIPSGEVNALGALADSHRAGCSSSSQPPTAMTMLLTDVGEEDDNGQPLKESHKAKKGGLAREYEDIEFIALSTVTSSQHPSSLPVQRVMMKQSKYQVEEDEDNTGQAPQLLIPKARLRKPMNRMTIRTDWNDIHVFCFSPWVIKLLEARPAIKDLSKDLLPLLVTRQFKGVKSCFGVKKNDSNEDGKMRDKKEAKELNLKRLLLSEQVLRDAPFGKNIDEGSLRSISVTSAHGREEEEGIAIDRDQSDHPFMVAAQVLSREVSKLTLRAHNIPSYMYSCREVATSVSTALKQIKSKSSGAKPSPEASTVKSLQPSQILISLPKGSTVNAKDNTIMLKDSSVGDKVAVKSSIIGKRSRISNRCRLNNVVLMDDVTVGDNCVLQNTVVSSGSIVGSNCKLNDCQVGPGYTVEDGTKEKGESFQVDDDGQGFFD